MEMRIPEIREELAAITELLGELTARMEVLTAEMVRRSPVKRAKPTSNPMNPTLAKSIRAYVKANPKASQKDVANVFNVNPGRVSEVLRGKRT